MGDRGQDLIGDPAPELEDPLLVAGGIEVSPLAREGQEVFVPARIAPNSSESPCEVPAEEEFLDHPADDWAVESVLLLIAGCVAPLELGKMFLHTLVEG
jgi:hypothetical protein